MVPETHQGTNKLGTEYKVVINKRQSDLWQAMNSKKMNLLEEAMSVCRGCTEIVLYTFYFFDTCVPLLTLDEWDYKTLDTNIKPLVYLTGVSALQK